MQGASMHEPIPTRVRVRSLAAASVVSAAVALPTLAWLQRLPIVSGGHGATGGQGGSHAHGGSLSVEHGPTLVHWLHHSLLALPLLVLVVALVFEACARRPRTPAVRAAMVGLSTAATLAVASLAHPLVGGGQAASGVLDRAAHVFLIFVLSLPVTLVSAAALASSRLVAPRGPVEEVDVSPSSIEPSVPANPRRPGMRRPVVALVSLGLLGSVSVLVPATRAAADTGGVCPVGARLVTYDVAAFQTVIPLNGWGDHLPDGLVYALKGDDARVGKRDILANPNVVQPLVVRANVGDCIQIKLRNDIDGRRVGMHADGLVSYDPRASDGAQVGRNPDSTAGPGQEVTYTWYAEREGEAPIVDVANLSSGHSGVAAPDTQLPHDETAPEVPDADVDVPSSGSVDRGLYGALIVHPAGSSWHDPRTGADLLDQSTGRAVQSALFADVAVPGAESFRSFAMVVLDENEGVLDRNGQTPTFPITGLEDSTFGINYRSEPLRNRLRAVLEHRGTPTPENPAGEARTIRLPSGQVITPSDHFCDGYVPDLGRVVEDPGAQCMGEESHLQSWVFGDEGKLVHHAPNGAIVLDSDNLIPKAYVGDPVRFHVVHPGAKETHPWHQHTQRWYADPNNADSPRLDVQAVGPGESYEMRIEGGAGGVQGTIGDSIFHCHLYPHFAQGFWGHLRIFDRLRDGTQAYPDATPIESLRALPDRPGAIPAPDAEHPGYPLFVKGDVGQRAYRPPYAVVADQFAAIRRPGDAPRSPTPLEAANLPGLHPDRPGAGYIDPCPANAPLRTYRPHAIDVPLTYNSAGWTDPEGRIYVEESHKDDVLAGRKAPEPYTIRSRVGDCVQLLTTNDLHLNDDPLVPVDHLAKGSGVYLPAEHTSEISTHVHLVRFDELGSDGTSVGWNYVQAAMPGQTYGYRWFVDQALRTVFFHDHQYANLHQQRGLFAAMNVEPFDATWHDPATGQPTDGIGVSADIRSASGPDFREFTVFYQDRAPMWKDHGAGDPIAPPTVPGDFGSDQGGYAINYRNEPFQIRTRPGAPGQKGDPAYVYSSAVHGDPSTPLLQAYPGDPVVIRNVTGSHEEMHTFNLHGHRWLTEPDNTASSWTDNQGVSLAEYFNFELYGARVHYEPDSDADAVVGSNGASSTGVPAILEAGAGGPGDYLYGSTALDDQWLGMWGIFRVHNALTPKLQPLPDRAAPGNGNPWPAIQPGQPVTPAGATRNPCWSQAPTRDYQVVAMRADLVYDPATGDHDPHAAIYALESEADEIAAGSKRPEPLTLRANAGDCVRVKLTNRLPNDGVGPHDGDVPLPADAPFPAGNRVSMHVSMLDYDVTRADGATVGYNFDQTVAPGESITYQWQVPPQLSGATLNLVDFGDRRGHRHHGLFGALLVEPAGSTWTDPTTGSPVLNGTKADIRWTDADGATQAYREFSLYWQDGLNLRDTTGAAAPTASLPGDAYEGGQRGVNYATAPFAPRLAANPDPAHVFSSQHHGDPATPVLRAQVGDPVRLRLLQGADRGRAHSFVLAGHGWHYQGNDTESTIRSAQGMILPGRSFTFDLVGGAGGPRRQAGDYLYRDGLIHNQVDLGLWGILRAEHAADTDLLPLLPPPVPTPAPDPTTQTPADPTPTPPADPTTPTPPSPGPVADPPAPTQGTPTPPAPAPGAPIPGTPTPGAPVPGTLTPIPPARHPFGVTPPVPATGSPAPAPAPTPPPPPAALAYTPTAVPVAVPQPSDAFPLTNLISGFNEARRRSERQTGAGYAGHTSTFPSTTIARSTRGSASGAAGTSAANGATETAPTAETADELAASTPNGSSPLPSTTSTGARKAGGGLKTVGYAGMLTGFICVTLAWRALRRRQ